MKENTLKNSCRVHILLFDYASRTMPQNREVITTAISEKTVEDADTATPADFFVADVVAAAAAAAPDCPPTTVAEAVASDVATDTAGEVTLD